MMAGGMHLPQPVISAKDGIIIFHMAIFHMPVIVCLAA
jgi:hypothetical protein